MAKITNPTPLTSTEIMQGLQHLGIDRGYRDLSSYDEMVATWGAKGLPEIPPLPDGSDDAAIALHDAQMAERAALAASYPSCPSEAALRAAIIAAQPDMGQLRAGANAKIVAYANALTARITAAYPSAEVASWPTREAEARALVAGEVLSEGSLLAALATAAGQTPEHYAARVLAKAAGYRQIVVAVTVIREAAQAAIAAAQSQAEIDAALAAIQVQADQRATELGIPR